MKEYRRQFRKILLLPLQFSGFSNIDAEIGFRSQMDVLMYVMDYVPDDIGVIVTCHPDYNILSSSKNLFLFKKYSNIIAFPEIEKIKSKSNLRKRR